MWFERLKEATRTSVWRFTIIFTVIVLCICLGILALVYRFTIGEQKQQLSQQVLITAQGISELAKVQGINQTAFRQAVQQRVDKSASLVLVLKTDDGLIGNLGSMPVNMTDIPKLQHFPVVVVDHMGQTSVTLALGGQIPTRFGTLLVGLFDDNFQAQVNDFRSASLFALLLALLVTLITGFLFNNRVLSRVNEIARVLSEVKAGQLKTRLPLSQRHDEFDMIAEHINQMLDEIDALLDSVAQVTDNIAHDLRTPLSRIHIAIEQGLQQSVEGSEDECWKMGLLDDLEQLIATFNAMLELSRLEQGVQGALFSELDIEALCKDVLELAQPLAEEKSQNLKFFYAEAQLTSSVIIKGERNLLFRALFNLVDNAIKYTQKQGTISLELNPLTTGCEIIVSDNGPGIPEALQDKVFQRLYRIDASRQGGGYGLGLAIVKAIIELHGGELKISSGQPGLRISIRLSD
jgi:signal transduction histidine kinase